MDFLDYATDIYRNFNHRLICFDFQDVLVCANLIPFGYQQLHDFSGFNVFTQLRQLKFCCH